MPRWSLGIAAAAAVALLVVGITRIVPLGIDDASTSLAVFETGPNELVTAVLEDGSVARLAPNSSLRATIGAHDRNVELQGRAFFAVAHDPDRVFRIETGSGNLRVLGTRFDLSTTRTGLRVVVLDGRVGVTAGGDEAELGAGEVAVASSEAPLSVVQVEAPEALLDWLGTWMAFEATPLRDVVRELEIRLGLQVVLEDPTVGDRTVTGWFSERDRDHVLDLICRVADVQCDRTEGVVRIR